MHLSALPSFLDWHWLWFTVASFLAGVLNAVAGGGSFLSFPAMLSMRILPVQANATNTVALWPGQLTSVAAYRDDIRKNLRLALPMGVAGLIGGAAGALVLLSTPQMTFLHMVPWLLLLSSSIFALTGPVSRWLKRNQSNRELAENVRGGFFLRKKPLGDVVSMKSNSGFAVARRKGNLAVAHHPPRRLPVFLATMSVCFYIGYFGAGAGFLLITVLSLFGYEDLHEINALKVVSTTLANGIAVVIFAVSGKVVWSYCLLAMLVCAIGGYSSARWARRIPQPILRGLVICIGLAMSAWFFWRQ